MYPYCTPTERGTQMWPLQGAGGLRYVSTRHQGARALSHDAIKRTPRCVHAPVVLTAEYKPHMAYRFIRGLQAVCYTSAPLFVSAGARKKRAFAEPELLTTASVAVPKHG
eukprot:5047877-Pyramimonas_sp.AAC.1